MKKIIILFAASLMLAACSANMSKNDRKELKETIEELS